jgi:hypothetical protein
MKKLTTEEFVQKAIIIHGNKYDYSKTKYINSRTKLLVLCKEHGEFLQAPKTHLSGSGCIRCSIVNKTLNTEDFIEKAIVVHGDRYDYSSVEYFGAGIKIIIICKVHGDFLQIPHNHLKGQTCRKCDNTRKSSTINEFINSANKIHNNFYRYDLVNYINTHTKVTIICPEHKEFLQSPGHHLNGQGCPSCAKGGGFDKNKPGYCYYIKFESKNTLPLYKIGITNSLIEKRIQTMKACNSWKHTILQELYFENGSEALNMETKILSDFKEFKYKGEKIMKNGNTELFTKDILNLDI